MKAQWFRTLPLHPREWSQGRAEFDVAGHGYSDSATTLVSAPVLAARLQERHPAASPAMVQNCIEDAIRHFDEGRVRLYLPILVERSASDSLRQAAHSLDPVDAPERGPI